jgi:hypothetical protein
LADDVANHLRSLLRDVICGHLDPDLAVIADELLEPDELLHADEYAESERAEPDQAGLGEPQRQAQPAAAEVSEVEPLLVAAVDQESLAIETDGVAEIDAVAPLS